MSQSTVSNDVEVQIQGTPNPHAWKFVLDRPVLLEGKATFSNISEAAGNPLAESLLQIAGVKQIHFFQNVITVTARFDIDPEEVQAATLAVIRTRMAIHDSSWTSQQGKANRRELLSPELQQIESILDRTVRPGLQGDGGDIEIIRLEDNKLYVLYQGACGTCPSATTGTLMAIESILRDEWNPTIEVVPL